MHGWSRYKLSFNFLEKCLGLVSLAHLPHFEKCLSCYILLADQISLSDCVYFFRYLAMGIM